MRIVNILPHRDTFYAFAHRADPDQARAARSGSPLLLKYDISDPKYTRLRRVVSNVSGNRCESDCRSRDREFDPDPVPYFCED